VEGLSRGKVLYCLLERVAFNLPWLRCSFTTISIKRSSPPIKQQARSVAISLPKHKLSFHLYSRPPAAHKRALSLLVVLRASSEVIFCSSTTHHLSRWLSQKTLQQFWNSSFTMVGFSHRCV
jgi:hypothetical protein